VIEMLAHLSSHTRVANLGIESPPPWLNLLFAIYGHKRLALLQTGRAAFVDMAKLRVPVRMRRSDLFHLLIFLLAVPQRLQRVSRCVLADGNSSIYPNNSGFFSKALFRPPPSLRILDPGAISGSSNSATVCTA